MTNFNDLIFSQNWNHKLDCDCFTTIRLCSKKYFKGAIYNVFLKKELIAKATIFCVKPFYLRSLTDEIALLDTGYNAIDTSNILRTMYKGKIDVDTTLFCVVYLRKIKQIIDETSQIDSQ